MTTKFQIIRTDTVRKALADIRQAVQNNGETLTGALYELRGGGTIRVVERVGRYGDTEIVAIYTTASGHESIHSIN